MSNFIQAIPPPVLAAFWPIIAVGIVAVILWRAFRWLLDRIDEQFRAAIRSEEFERVIDRRVAAAFDGALRPLMGAHADLAGKVQTAQNTADAAHRRIDEYLGKGHA